LNDAKIEYPCTWAFRVIGVEEKAMTKAVRECVGGREFTLERANTSRTGKFLSLNLETVVENEVDRNRLFQTLRDHDAVKMVL